MEFKAGRPLPRFRFRVQCYSPSEGWTVEGKGLLDLRAARVVSRRLRENRSQAVRVFDLVKRVAV